MLRWLRRVKDLGLPLIFFAAGFLHFHQRDFLIRMMPGFIPFHGEIVLLTGLADFLLAFVFLFPRIRPLAAWGMILYLTAVFPANIHMAFHPEIFPNIPAWAAWARLPIQPVLIFWAYLNTRGINRDPCPREAN